jgi:hypothetical protein
VKWNEADEAPDTVALPTQGKLERAHLYDWIVAEEVYVHDKFKDERAKHDASWENGFDSFWFGQIVQYYDRAKQFFDGAAIMRREGETETARHLEMKGQQALAKAMMTAKGCVESSIRTFGNMPTPGVPSGEISEWDYA